MKFVIESVGLTAGGGKELAIDLMTRLATHTEHQFTFIVPDMTSYQAISGVNIRKLICQTSAGLVQRAVFLNHEVPKICRAIGADGLLCLGNFPAPQSGCPTLVLLHNPWVVYSDPGAAFRRTNRERLITAYARHRYRHLPSGITIVTQTRIMKDRLCRRYKIDPGRVVIIPNACSFEKPVGDAAAKRAKQQNGSRPFRFLCLARYYAQKNIEMVLQAAERLSAYTSRTAECVITIAAEQHPGARKLLARLESSAQKNTVRNIGPVPAAKLPEVYRNADALIHPTLLESYSRTYLEAMHFGLPILTSDRDFAREGCRDAAVYFDPLDADSVAKSMAEIMEDQALHERLVQNGWRIEAQVPNWDEIASRFVEVLESAARGERPEVNRPDSSLAAERHATVHTARSRSVSIKTGQSVAVTPSADEVRIYFNHKAGSWRHKYYSTGKLRYRLERFTARVAELALRPGRILDLGCGTGDLAAAIHHMGYQVTACDIAEEMIGAGTRISRRNWGEMGFSRSQLEAPAIL